jgi:hypothetical protein
MLDTDDALEATITFSNVEDMVDQTTMTRVLKLMSNVQELHGLQFGRRPEVNSELPLKDLSIDVEVIRDGDHWLLTTSGITTMVLELFVKTLATVKV